MVKAHGLRSCSNRCLRAAAADRDCADGPTRSIDDGNCFSLQQIRCLHRVHGQGLQPLYSEGLLQHHGRDLRLQSTERARSAVGMRGDRHMQEIDAGPAFQERMPYGLFVPDVGVE
jgi:hypothetical protein